MYATSNGSPGVSSVKRVLIALALVAAGLTPLGIAVTAGRTHAPAYRVADDRAAVDNSPDGGLEWG